MELNKELYDKLTPYKFYWEALKRDGSLKSIAPHELEVMAAIYKGMGFPLNKTCSECLKDMIVYLGIQYRKFGLYLESTQPAEPVRDKRPRIQNHGAK
jgi:hypothetical protein